MKEDQGDVVLNAIIRTDQKAMLNQIAKDDDRSVSGALRFILDDWVEIKKAALTRPEPAEVEAVTT
jgi:hypothetical protein